jgi:DNA (cytosine-5)-methyltransferase 1
MPGFMLSLKMCNEIRSDLAEHAMVHNDAFDDQTIMANLPLQELAFDDEVVRRLPEVDIVDLGLPCSGASQAGRSKNKIALPEHHSAVGHLIAPAIALLAKLNPVACVMENVTAYADSASAAILRGYLGDMGYEVHERELVGSEWGELEAQAALVSGCRHQRHPIRFRQAAARAISRAAVV